MIDREIAPIWHDRFARLILRNLPLKSGQFALDIHSGPGRLSTEVLQRLDPTSRVLAIEPDDTLIELAKSRIRPEWRNRVYVKGGDFSDIFQMAAASYDLVMGNLVLGEGTELAPAVGELLRVTKPGGHVLATLPLQGTWQEVEDIFAEVLRDAGLKHAVRRLERLRSLRPPASLLGDLLKEMNCPVDNYVIESEQLQMIFPSGREFLFAPVIEHGPLRLWKAIIGDEGSPQELFWRLKEAIDVYYSGQVLAVTVVAGLIHVQIPDPHDAEPSLAAQYWSRYPELDRLWGGLARSLTAGQQPAFAFSDEDVDEFDLDLDIDIDDGFDDEDEPELASEPEPVPEPEPARHVESHSFDDGFDDGPTAVDEPSVYDSPAPSYDHYAGAPGYEEPEYAERRYAAPERGEAEEADASAAVVAEPVAEPVDDGFDDYEESSFAGLAEDEDEDEDAGSSIAAAIEDELSGGLLDPGQAEAEVQEQAAFDDALTERAPEAADQALADDAADGAKGEARSDDEPDEDHLSESTDSALAGEVSDAPARGEAAASEAEADGEADDGPAEEPAAGAEASDDEVVPTPADTDDAGEAADADEVADRDDADRDGAERDAGVAAVDSAGEATVSKGDEVDGAAAVDDAEPAVDDRREEVAARPLRGLRGGLPLKLGSRSERSPAFRAPSFTPPPPTPALSDHPPAEDDGGESAGEALEADAVDARTEPASQSEAKPRGRPGLPGLPSLPGFRAPSPSPTPTPAPASDDAGDDGDDDAGDDEVLELDDELLEVEEFEEVEDQEVASRPPPPPKPPPPPRKPLKPRPLLPIPFGAPPKKPQE